MATITKTTAVLVLGMHRSGTSALTRLLGALGAALPADPNPPAADNPEGYWESAGVVRQNDALLFAADSAWLDTRPLDLGAVQPERLWKIRRGLGEALERSFGSSACFALKDPRICRMVPFYRQLLAERGVGVKVAIVLRHPSAAAASLHQRNQISMEYGALLWARHVLEAELQTRDLPRVVVDYDEAMRDWRVPARRLGGLLGLDSEHACAIDGAALFRQELRHHLYPSARGSRPAASVLAGDLYEAISRLREQDDATARGAIDSVAARLEPICETLTDVLTAERCFQRLTSPYDTVGPLSPAQERLDLAAAWSRIHTRLERE